MTDASTSLKTLLHHLVRQTHGVLERKQASVLEEEDIKEQILDAAIELEIHLFSALALPLPSNPDVRAIHLLLAGEREPHLFLFKNGQIFSSQESSGPHPQEECSRDTAAAWLLENRLGRFFLAHLTQAVEQKLNKHRGEKNSNPSLELHQAIELLQVADRIGW